MGKPKKNSGRPKVADEIVTQERAESLSESKLSAVSKYDSGTRWGTGVRIRCLIQPRASRNAVCVLHDNDWKIALMAPPVDGEANQALVQFLSKLFQVSKSQVLLVSGQSSRRKVVAVAGIAPGEAERILQQAAGA